MKCECADLRAKTGEWWDCDICAAQAIEPKAVAERRRYSPSDFPCSRCSVPAGETCINDGTLHGREFHVSRRERADEANLQRHEICQCGKPLAPREHVMEEDDWNCKNRTPAVTESGESPPRPTLSCFVSAETVRYISALEAKVARLERTNTWVSDQRAMKHFKERAEKAESALAQSRQREQEMRGKLEQIEKLIYNAVNNRYWPDASNALIVFNDVFAAIPKEETNGK